MNGIDSAAGQVFTGHVDEKSARFYRRANPDAAANVGAAVTGTEENGDIADEGPSPHPVDQPSTYFYAIRIDT